MQKSKALAAILVVALLAMAAVGATLAYLTDAEDTDVHYKLGNVSITVKEENWDKGNGVDGQSDYFNEDGEAYLFPTRVIQKDPTVSKASGSEDCYVRVKIDIDPILHKVIHVPAPGDGWTRDPATDKANVHTYYYYYEKPLTEDHATSKPAFTEVIVKAEVPGYELNHREILDEAKDGKIRVQAEAVQSAGFSSVQEAFRAIEGFA